MIIRTGPTSYSPPEYLLICTASSQIVSKVSNSLSSRLGVYYLAARAVELAAVAMEEVVWVGEAG